MNYNPDETILNTLKVLVTDIESGAMKPFGWKIEDVLLLGTERVVHIEFSGKTRNQYSGKAIAEKSEETKAT